MDIIPKGERIGIVGVGYAGLADIKRVSAKDHPSNSDTISTNTSSSIDTNISTNVSISTTTTPHYSYKELMFLAARMAYEDADIMVRREDRISFICCTEDFWEGNMISDEYMPDQLGAVLRPLCTVAADGLYGLITGFMQIRSGLVDVAVVEAHSKLSDVVSRKEIVRFALDPVYIRGIHPDIDPYFIAGLEMNRFLYETGNSRESCANVVSKNKGNALANPRACYASNVDSSAVLSSPVVAYPLTSMEVSNYADASIVVVLASEHKARMLKGSTDGIVWIDGVGLCSDTPWIHDRNLADATYASLAAEMAYRMAGIEIDGVNKYIDLAEIDDTFSYKELQHMEALRLCRKGEAGILVKEGFTAKDGDMPVNPSGGSLGVGYLVEATGIHRVLEATLQLRGSAGGMQVQGARRALVQSWRGLPTASGAVVLLSSNQ
ncbi:hypothetical protein HRbin04_00095 [archaeon HR04]|nr:hypothetical protein HRbin04_00095 [archaeon HR04]